MTQMTEKYCQSCGMPMTDQALFGLEASGETSKDYCKYCYVEGKFIQDNMTMDEMIEICVPHMKAQGMEEDKARDMMKNFLPTLKRWK